MKKILTVFLALVMLSILAFTQPSSSGIYGKVVIRDGSPLPDVTVILTGNVIGQRSTRTS